MKNLIKYTSFLIMVSFLISCGSGKSLTTASGEKLSAKTLIKKHKAAEPDFKTLYAKLRGSYHTKDETQSIGVSMRMEKDKAIWLSAKLAGIIPLAKVYITPERVQYYEKINGTYFDGDFALLSKWLGTDLDYDKVQNLLLGQSIYPLEKNGYSISNSASGYQLKKEKEEAGLLIQFLLDPGNFTIKGTQLLNEEENKSLTLTYSEYKAVKQQLLPKEINIIVNQAAKNTRINIQYRSVELDVPVDFPFKIPNGYEEIEL
ncbi:DUF4292 domain-containing protein [Haloflavibacter putidus]|uniref:DUF4292 domain-containing protein n=1 Tax=Haloflavibacter putidus TaxID=2576776 RepID=UPI001F4926FC|nr:DUF4292 domain-containing protein [Haloflavibacter putidus]